MTQDIGLPPWYVDFMPLISTGYLQSVFSGYISELSNIFNNTNFLQKLSTTMSETYINTLKNFTKNSTNNPLVNIYETLNITQETFKNLLLSEIRIKCNDDKNFVALNFLLQIFFDTFSTHNNIFLNPCYWEKILENNGANLINGIKNFYYDAFLNSGTISTVDKTMHSIGDDIANTPGMVVWQNDLVQLIRYKPCNKVYSIPLLIIPPFINKYYILDIGKGKSIVSWLVQQGYDTFLVSWCNPTPSMTNLKVEDYVVEGIKKPMDALLKLMNVSKVNVMGYCIGGTFLMMLAGALTKQKNFPINSITLLNTLLDFSFPGASGIFIKDELVNFLQHNVALIRGDAMSGFFSWLKPNELIWHYVINNYFLGKQVKQSSIMYWNSDPPRLVGKMFAEYLQLTYLNNVLTKANGMNIYNNPVDLSEINIPIYCLAAIKDHITPFEATFQSAKMLNNAVLTAVDSGHVMSVLSIPEFKKYAYYSKMPTNKDIDSSTWLKNTTCIENNTWWDHWNSWQKQLSGEKIKSQSIKKIEDAPGSYVKSR
ncbi:polyhydroxyalkanoate synthase subunit PhaC [Candidatus Xenohaliotis californiensis]|uniref:Polyhydroxyalkanoate synthase subunit PhaC n=1 Tax=Candidatus Xenohaliotis californiensis TaxID=84677 RepID=A0ABP0ETZ7_9RICK|nr:polyhydroxyalkanoate synthase subunit PhaC [Candidatus Xenohaliotis californiensis]